MIDISLDIQNIFLQAHVGILNWEEIDVIALLESRKWVILSNEAAAWRLKSRAIWLKEGDANTKIFHASAKARRNTNSIWDLHSNLGKHIHSQEDRKREAIQHFFVLFKDLETSLILDQMKVIQ